jgi:hypothetical protein
MNTDERRSREKSRRNETQRALRKPEGTEKIHRIDAEGAEK